MHVNLARKKVADLLSLLHLDAIVFCKTENLRYLCGFTGSDGVVVATASQLVFLTDSRYTTQAHSEVSADRIHEYKIKVDAVVELLKSHDVDKVGFEASLTVGFFEELKVKGDSEWLWVNLKDHLQKLRLHKSPVEIEKIVAAVDLNEVAFNKVADMIRPGVMENQVALALEFELRKLGGEEKAFDIIVASGDRGALPHGIASNKVIREG
jgi:Xaa-Pro aminopeptidase